MSILITGANGEIGFDLVSKLSKKNKVYALYRSKKNKSRRIKNKNIKWIKCDLKKKIKFNSENAIKYIIHCAVDQKYRGKNKNYYINNNKSIINNIINFANKRSINLIINLSTIDVYGKIKSNIVHENFKPLKQNSYAYFKYFAENELYKQKTNFINLRLPGTLCNYSNKKPLRPWLFKTIFDIYNKNKIVVKNIKCKFNNVISSKDIVDFFNYIKNKKMVIRDTFNFSASKPIKLYLMLKLIKKRLNSNSRIIELKKKNSNSFLISNKKLKIKLNYKTPSTEIIIKNFLDNFNDQISQGNYKV
tara:strand:+ start:906 stop:1817 length:912 start_codon:yes stop_codon:yes gene_type:complete